MAQNIDKKALLRFIEKNNWGVLSTVNTDGLPDAAPMYYLADQQFNCSFVVPVNSKKSKNIDHQNEVVLTVTNEERRETLQIRGKVEKKEELLIEKLKELAGRLNVNGKFVSDLPLLQHKGQEKTVLVLTPTMVRMRRYFSDRMEEEVLEV